MREGGNRLLEELPTRSPVQETQIGIGVLRRERIFRRRDHLQARVLRRSTPVVMMLRDHDVRLLAQVDDRSVPHGVCEESARSQKRQSDAERTRTGAPALHAELLSRLAAAWHA